MTPKIRTKSVYVVDFAVASPKEDELVDMQSTCTGAVVDFALPEQYQTLASDAL